METDLGGKVELVRHYIQLCRSPVTLTFSEWLGLAPEHRAALEEANQVAKQLAWLEAQTLTAESVFVGLSGYDGGRAFSETLWRRNTEALAALEKAGVVLSKTKEVSDAHP